MADVASVVATELEPSAFVRDLIEFAAHFMGMREHLRMAKVWLRDPAATQRAFAVRRSDDSEVVEVLRALTRDLETMGAA